MLNQEYALVDGSYFVGQTPAENSQIQFGKVSRWTHPRDEARHMMNSNNFAQRRHSSSFLDGRSMSIKVYSLRLLLQVTFALNHARMHQTQKRW